MNTHPITGSHEYERALFRMIELTLNNPRAGSDEESELVLLNQRTRLYEKALSVFREHPLNGDVCACQIHCAGVACGCWCHSLEVK